MWSNNELIIYANISRKKEKGFFYKQINQFGDGSLDKHWGCLNEETEAERNTFDVHSLLFLELISEFSSWSCITIWMDKPYNNKTQCHVNKVRGFA